MENNNNLLKHRIIFINGEINPLTSARTIEELLLLSYEDSNKDITIYVNSPGGSVTDGLAIIDTMNIIPNDVNTIGIGLCASMGALILCNGTKNKRAILPNSEVMIHEIIVNNAQGNATNVINNIEHAKKVHYKLIDILAKNTNKDRSIVEKDIIIDKWMSAEEALEYGLVDKIVSTK